MSANNWVGQVAVHPLQTRLTIDWDHKALGGIILSNCIKRYTGDSCETAE